MTNGNYPSGTANSVFAPWNQKEVSPLNVELAREIYTECCGCDDFNEDNGVHYCGDCGKECSIFTESDDDYQARLERAEEEERERIENIKESWREDY